LLLEGPRLQITPAARAGRQEEGELLQEPAAGGGASWRF
jgi:hypothetical protein